jgi:hypothetical protein
MKNPLRLVSVASLLFPAFAFAVYAPIPEQDQGKALTVRLGASIYHDSNIFGSPNNEVDSLVYSFTPGISYNASVSDQTFFSAGYDLTYDHIVDRPGRKNLTSHTASVRLAHAFSPDTNIDVSDRYQISKNPQSLLAGIPLNTDQSFKMNEFNARFATPANEKTGLTFKLRHLSLAYDTAALATQLDRSDVLAGVEAAFAVLPETKVIGEYRYLNVGYDKNSAFKDKRSNFLLAGVDHSPSKQLTLTARAGFEDRTRERGTNVSSPYAELSGRYAYGEDSFLAGGYSYTIEEPSDVIRFSDSKVNRFFLNAQHRLSGAVTASGSVTFEPSQLQGIGSQRDLDEETTRFGLALSWTPTKNWTVTATYDVDHVTSDDAARSQDRNRYGVSARFSF